MANTPGTRTDWQTEDAYWRENYKRRPYFETGREYEFYSPAYRSYFAREGRFRMKRVLRCGQDGSIADELIAERRVDVIVEVEVSCLPRQRLEAMGLHGLCDDAR